MLADLLAKIGAGAASTGSSGCFILMIDEPECPESLIK